MKADLKETNNIKEKTGGEREANEISVWEEKRRMQSPCLKEVSQVCLHGCCPSPFLMSSHEPQGKASKPTSTSAACRRDFASKTTSSILPNAQFTDHESLPPVEEAFSEFTKAYPQYCDTYQVDQIRAQEYYLLSFSNHTCFDYLGIGLFSYSQLLKRESPTYMIASSSYPVPPQSPPPVLDIPFFGVSYKTGNLKTQLLHGGPTSELESVIRKRIMTFLNISENEYSMVFTANKTSAFKLLAESYPFLSNRKLLTVYDYESEAIEAMTHSSEKRGARVMPAEFSWPRLRIQSSKLKKMVVSKEKKKKKKRGLFVFPLHSRMTGARYPYLWMSIAQENRWHVLIDACALGPKDMDSFGLSLFRPDFLICSFYKVFGENPSGFACLFAKKSTIPILETSISSGMVGLIPAKKLFRSLTDSPGTDSEVEQISNPTLQVDKPSSISSTVLVQASQSGRLVEGQIQTYKIQHAEVSEKLKGLEIAEISESEKATDIIQDDNLTEKGELKCRGLDQVDSLGLGTISNRARCLINWLVNALLKLQHPNTKGAPLVRIYGPKIKFDRGPAISFNVFDWKGEKVEPVLVQKLADRSNISLSYGFLHHICFADKYQEEKDKVMERSKEAKGTDENKRKDKNDMRVAVVTAALGFLANFEDIYKLWAFIAQFLDADFVEKERWRYTALNQKTVEV